jgi:hypothetical protein
MKMAKCVKAVFGGMESALNGKLGMRMVLKTLG